MFLIDLNNCYFNVVNGGRVWAHDLDELQWLTPDNSVVHVRRGQEIAQLPLTVVYQWLFSFNLFGINREISPEQYIDQALKRREPVLSSYRFDFEDCDDDFGPEDIPAPLLVPFGAQKGGRH